MENFKEEKQSWKLRGKGEGERRRRIEKGRETK